MLPVRLRERLAANDRRLVVLVEDSRALLLLETGEAAQHLGTVDFGPGEDRSAAVHDILRRHGLASALDRGALAAVLRLPADKALRPAITLPLAAEVNLHEVICYELDRHTPFTTEQVYLSARVASRDPTARRLEADVTVVPRPVVDRAIADAKRLGLAVDRVDVAGVGTQPPSGNVLPAARLTAGRRQASRANAALAIAAGLLAAVAVYVPLARMEREAAALEQHFAAIRAAVSLQRQVADARRQRLFIVDRKRAAAPVSVVLLELTRILPDDTWLTELQIQGDEVQIGGTARSAAALIGLLEQSHEFTGTTFRTPVTQDPVSGRESFYIVARITTERTK
jgi:general secretion pathway protein L